MACKCFLKIEGVPGESSDNKHKDWIEVMSFSHSVSQTVTASRSGAGARTSERCDHSDFSILKSLDKSSPKLALYCCNGTHIKEVKMEVCHDSGDNQTYMKYNLTDVIVSSYRPSGSSKGGESLPMEEVSFNYGKIEWIYTATDPKTGKPAGDVKANWDLIANKGA